jgi:hypothetical protein
MVSKKAMLFFCGGIVANIASVGAVEDPFRREIEFLSYTKPGMSAEEAVEDLNQKEVCSLFRNALICVNNIDISLGFYAGWPYVLAAAQKYDREHQEKR